MKYKKSTAIVLAAGKGSRMNLDVKKQFFMLSGKPVLYYSLKKFEESFIEDIVLVASEEDIEYCKNEIIEKYKITKVRDIAVGGKERYDSVLNGLLNVSKDTEYVFIHDGARPFPDLEMLKRAYETVDSNGTAVAAVAVKDTIKTADDNGFVIATPNRNSMFIIQTPQVFKYEEIKTAYEKLHYNRELLKSKEIMITDDAMVMEHFGSRKIKLFEGSYRNIKLTTKEDLILASEFLTVGL
ncbi:MAG: 2-C-methyl-D-erythritol 4-phosphate cytidylyltransferase [Lachnospiraceae bacterium]|nr:2-C-methyl-D-erythritol 4-phosphate cytidylyltransferase [Lachnospiraceae bacterium]